ncbi:hypothetical protein [Maritimibacter dapengensis]|uniref:Uncharacterized protein n=1 Tax=Maritimibacter dapengensis TaxID=2836868 RepID=A0ABS6SY67_9RHOB|nr:hypothetical protein [Maritimibacter dapengensis]MBV7377892.1 hypothetical protein [Maritimibacter dapengensis]
MVDINQQDFHSRLYRIERTHRNLSSGYVRLEERNGLLVPVRRVRSRRGFPWRGLFLVLIAFLVFKASLLAQIGPVRYVEHHSKLEQGSIVEQMGAWALRPDPATVYISEKIAPYLRQLTQLITI